MAIWYVRTTGSDAAAGTSAATAFATISKAMSTANASLADGDIIYVGGGTYRLSATVAPKSMGAMTYLYGDVDGAKTGDSGEVVVTTYGTNDSSAPGAYGAFTFASVSYWTMGKLTIVGYGTSLGQSGLSISGNSANLTFQDLTLYGYTAPVYSASVTFGTIQNLTIERCRIIASGAAVWLELPTASSGTGEINANIVFRNNIVIGLDTIPIYCAGTSNTARKTGGVSIKNCMVLGYYGVYATANVSATHKVTVTNSLLMGAYPIYAAAASVMTEDYNIILGTTTARTNVSAGANSIADRTRSHRFSYSHEASFGGVTRPWGEFPPGSPLLTWGGTAVATDDINAVTRPASGAAQGTAQQALGPFERANSATRETTTTRTGGTAIKIAGPGYHDFELAVSPVSTSVSVWSYKDNAYGTAATGPQLIIANAGEAGYAGTTITSTGGTGAWAAMTATFTPTSAGIVTVRLQSNATVGTANVYFDDFAVA